MSAASHYSAARARRSLGQFAAGKLVSALAGLLVLLLSVRLMAASEFGLYVAALAFLEIFYLATGFGLSTMAQRYVAEYRLKAGDRQFARFLRGLLTRRLLYALVCVAVVVVAAGGLQRYAAAYFPAALHRPEFYALLVLGSLTRYFDELFPALLLQGYTQGLLIAAHFIRLGGLLTFRALGIEVDFARMIALELGAAAVCASGGFILLKHYLAQSHGSNDNPDDHSNPRMPGVARRFYLVQLMGQVWSPNTGKLIVARMLGLATTAQYGFLQSITDMLRNYLPAYLLSTWVRPLMVSRYLARGGLDDVNAMASLLFKLSLMCLVPLAAFFLSRGDVFAFWASGGKFSTGAILLSSFCLLLALQCLHIVVSMITLTVERAGASVAATFAACVAFPLSIVGAATLQAPGVVAGMAIGECIWIGLVFVLLRREGLPITLDIGGSVKILSLLLPAYLAVALLPENWPALAQTLVGMGIAGMVVLAGGALLKPFRQAEREFIHRLVPPRYFFW